MCLEIKKGQRAKIAKVDIKCYKVIKYKHTVWVTLYKEMKVYPGIQYESDIIIEKLTYYSVIEEALHSFTTFNHAHHFLRDDILYTIKIVECIIPRGSKYYIGEFRNPNDSYASDTLIYPETF